MRLVEDAAWNAFVEETDVPEWTGTRIKKVRTSELKPGGRARLTLFEQADGEGRAHPRLRVSMPVAEDPSPPIRLLGPPPAQPTSPAEFEEALKLEIEQARPKLELDDLDMEQAPAGSPNFWKNTIARVRKARFWDEARYWVTDLKRDSLIRDEDEQECRYILAVHEALSYAGAIDFDDSDTGTYHSFQHDAPFVHYLEVLIESLPKDGDQAMLLLQAVQQDSVRRQRQQAQNHLDWLMSHKYANHGIEETDIERSLGGFLVDRETRFIVSETEASKDSLSPKLELLRIEPQSDHPKAGEYVYRDGEGVLRLQDHSLVEGEPELRAIAKTRDHLTFRRAPEDENLRSGVRFDWNGDGYVQSDEIGWISWAGHCDIKAVVECLGITLKEDPPPTLTEFRSDTGEETVYTRDLLLEMLCSTIELGSIYQTMDGSQRIQRGVHLFGGARNDSRPDRLQFKGFAAGRSFRWPLSGRQDAFKVIKLTDADDTVHDINEIFLRLVPDTEAVTFAPNPRYLRTIEGDYNLIDVSGMLAQALVKVDRIDKETGYLSTSTETTAIDLRPGAEPGRDFLGTHVQSAPDRLLYRLYLDRGEGEAKIVAELEKWEQDGGEWKPTLVEAEKVEIPLLPELSTTLSREMKRDAPQVFKQLLDIAIREGRNINADTDMAAEVWNGTVTAVSSVRLAENRDGRTEHWKVEISARFGDATLEYLLSRTPDGDVEDYCPVAERWSKAPDFLWQDFPDVGSKGTEGGEWVVNESMLERGIVIKQWMPSAPGGAYIHDDHIKSLFEMMFAAFGGYPFTVVHLNKRWGFSDQGEYEAAKKNFSTDLEYLAFVDPEAPTIDMDPEEQLA